MINLLMKFIFPHRNMEQVKIHDDCGGIITYIESCCGIQTKCQKCKKIWEGYWKMGEQPIYHLKWRSKEGEPKDD